jgi:hypothetical protein
MEKLGSYIRTHRPPDAKLEYDRMVRLSLNWLDTHKIKEKNVFQEQEGKEYNAMLNSLEERLGYRPEITPELFILLLNAKQ